MKQRLSDMNLPRFPLLPDETIRKLIKNAQDGDSEARDKLINCNLKLVFNLVQRFQNRGYDLEDIFQIGTIGLIKAIDKFDLSYDVRFSTYAVPLIVGEIRRFLRDDSPVKISRSVKETAYKIQQQKDALSGALGREPTIGEISASSGLAREEIVNALEAMQTPTSLYETLYQDDGDPIYIMDQIGVEENAEGRWLDNISLRDVVKKLSDREKQVILLRFFEDRTQAEVAEKLGVSQVQISRIERQALKNIKKYMSQEETKDAG